MAIWHFKFGLIPTEGLKRVFGDAGVAVVPEYAPHPEGPRYLEPEELAALPNYWDDPDKLRQIATAVSSFLPEMKSWSDKARMFGSDEDERVAVWEDDVHCRINMRNVDFEVLDKLLSLARRFDCKVVVHGTGAVVDADITALTPHVEASSAHKFCHDPHGFLTSLKPTLGDRNE